MSRERSRSRDSRAQTAVVMWLLGCSIALCCVVSFVQLGTLTHLAEPARPSSALRKSEHALMFAVKSRIDAHIAATANHASVLGPHNATPGAVHGNLSPLSTGSVSTNALALVNTSSRTSAPALRNRDHGSTRADEHESALPSLSSKSVAIAITAAPAQHAPVLVDAPSSAPPPSESVEEPLAPPLTAAPPATAATQDPAVNRRVPSSRTRGPVTDPATTGATTHEPESLGPTGIPSKTKTGNRVPARAAPTRKSAPTLKPTRTVKRIPEPRVHVQRGSKGIVMCLYERIVPLGVSLIRELRCLGNDERIEVFHCDELSAASLELLHKIDNNVHVIDACSELLARGVLDRVLTHSFQSYWLKPLAVHQTTLEELILLDADDVLLRDPAVLRATPGYRTNGTLFFYDRVVRRKEFFNSKDTVLVQNSTASSLRQKPKKKSVRHLKHWIETFDYARFGLAPRQPSAHLLASFAYRGKTCHEQDSSLLLLHKRHAAKAMEVLWFLITEERFVYDFSWGDKEAFWLAYEFSHTPYFFSPWGASVVSSAPNDDLARHPRTLCGSLAHYMPINDSDAHAAPELLYINGKALVDPVPFDVSSTATTPLRANQVFNVLPTHVTPRQVRTAVARPEQGRDYVECLTNLGADPVPRKLRGLLWRRRLHFLAVSMGMLEPLWTCSDSSGVDNIGGTGDRNGGSDVGIMEINVTR